MNANKQVEAFDQLLETVLFRTDCPSPERLYTRQVDQLSVIENHAIDRHLAACPHCSAEYASLAAPQPKLNSWRETVQAWIKTLIPDITPVLAKLVGDEPKMALRGNKVAKTIFEAGEYRVLLKVSPSAKTANQSALQGSVFNLDNPLEQFDGQIHLMDKNKQTREVSINDYGFFAINRIDSGDYTLLIRLTERTIWIDNLTVPQ